MRDCECVAQLRELDGTMTHRRGRRPMESNLNTRNAPILNIEDGVRRFAGNKAIYLTLLKKFCEMNQNYISELQAAATAQNRPTCVRMLHSMKGAAGNVSATALFELSRDMEIMAHQNPDLDVNTLIPQLSAALQALFDEVKRITAAP